LLHISLGGSFSGKRQESVLFAALMDIKRVKSKAKKKKWIPFCNHLLLLVFFAWLESSEK